MAGSAGSHGVQGFLQGCSADPPRPWHFIGAARGEHGHDKEALKVNEVPLTRAGAGLMLPHGPRVR